MHALTDAAGIIVEAYQYDAYGRATVFTGPGSDGIWFTGDESQAAFSAIGNAYMYTGQRFDGESGLAYFKNRYYEADLGRFVGRDPLEYWDSMSLYAAYFVPNRLDPSGTRWEINESACTIKYIHEFNLVSAPDDWTMGQVQQWFAGQQATLRQIWNNHSILIKSNCCAPCKQWTLLFDSQLKLGSGRGGDFRIQDEGTGASWDSDDRSITAGGGLPANDLGLSHEVGHELGLDHPGVGLSGGASTADPYIYAGTQPSGRHRGEPVNGVTDLMGKGRGLRGFYFTAWADQLKSKYPKCDFTITSR